MKPSLRNSECADFIRIKYGQVDQTDYKMTDKFFVNDNSTIIDGLESYQKYIFFGKFLILKWSKIRPKVILIEKKLCQIMCMVNYLEKWTPPPLPAKYRTLQVNLF